MLKIQKHNGPFLIHAITQKGKGYKPAEESADKYHGVKKFNPATGSRKKAIQMLCPIKMYLAKL